MNASELIEVRSNTILDTRATTSHGIEIHSGTDVTIIGNRVLNTAGTGKAGIIDSFNSSTGVICIDNTVAGFMTAFSGCDVLSGNVTP